MLQTENDVGQDRVARGRQPSSNRTAVEYEIELIASLTHTSNTLLYHANTYLLRLGWKSLVSSAFTYTTFGGERGFVHGLN